MKEASLAAMTHTGANWSERTDAASLLVRRVAEGDVQALAFLYQQHHQAVRAFARRLLGNENLAEDLVQDVFLAAPAAFRGYRNESEVRTFLISIAVNKSRHRVRAASRWRRALERFRGEPAADIATPPDQAAERRELCDELQRALDQLPVDQRVVVILCAVEERTAREVAEIVGAPENTVRTRLFHAKRKLRDLMGEEP
jgi:RNA polymerase sigma-70 factor (ECF subfamily)